MAILEETHHSFLIVEHDPLFSEDAGRGMVECMTQDLKRTLQGATILLYAKALDPRRKKMTELAARKRPQDVSLLGVVASWRCSRKT